MASGVQKALGHIMHVAEWHQFFNVQPLAILTFFHGLDELVPITVPLSGIERGDLAGIKASHHMDQVPLPT